MAAAAIPLVIGGTLLSAKGSYDEGKARYTEGVARKEMADLESLQLEKSGKADVAKSHKVASEERRKARLLQSAATAKLAASGSASDPTAIKITSDIEKAGKYNSLMALWSGKESEASKKLQAAMTRHGGGLSLDAGRRGARAAKTDILSTMFSGTGSAFGMMK